MRVLERMERQAVLLERGRSRAEQVADVLALAEQEYGRWNAIDAALRAEGVHLAARNTWVQLVNDDPRGNSADGISLASFTTSAAIFPAIVFPANFFKTGRKIHVRARSEWGCTTGSPTMTYRLQETAGTVVTLCTTAAISLGASAVSNQKAEWDIIVQCRTEGTSGTLLAMGEITVGCSTASISGAYYAPAVGTAATTATVDTTVQQTWQLEVACSASNASNVAKGIDLEIKSIN